MEGCIMATATENIAATRTEPEVGEHRFVIYNLGWDRYEALLELFGDDGPRMNYSGGNVELMSPLIPHERFGNLLGFMIESLIVELDIPANALGSTTYKRRLVDRGLEADECYYIANAGKLGDRRRPDLDVDPPPDLAVEIEITHSLVDKLGIYAGIGVPEIWRFDGETLSVLLLQPDGTYTRSETSRSLPFLPMGDFARFLDEYDQADETGWRRSFLAWVRQVLLPLYQNQARPE
jgi:Uma2 family endonuclease